MIKIMSSSQDLTKTAAQIRFGIILDEMDVKQAAFEKEAKMRRHKIDQRLEVAKHNILVAEHDFDEDVRVGMKQMQKAADAVILPEEV